MAQMAVAFTFQLLGEEKVSGRPAYVLIASPAPGYKPVNREAKVLVGMQGKLWIDKAQFHWAKIQADVLHPVTFAGFLAKVGPGTRFELENEPLRDSVMGPVWEPKRFEVHVSASVLFFQRNSTTVETFGGYTRQAVSRLQPDIRLNSGMARPNMATRSFCERPVWRVSTRLGAKRRCAVPV
jgi:hypothetical protein